MNIYKDWYCEDIFEAYINRNINIDEVLLKLDYEKVKDQVELFNFLNLILTNKYPHKCFNNNCQKKLYFSNTFKYAKEKYQIILKDFVKIWVAPYNLNQYKNWNISIPFFCCDCFEKKGSIRK